MKLLLSKKEKAKYYRRLRLKIYAGFAIIALAGIGLAYGILNLGWLDTFQKEQAVIGEVKEEKFAIWCTEGSSSTSSETNKSSVPESHRRTTSCYWIDRNGIAGSSAPMTEGSSIPTIKNKESGALTVGQLVAAERFIKPIIGIINGVNNLPVRIKEYSFSGKFQELTAIGVAGDRFIFSVRFEPNEKLFASLAEVIAKNNLKNFEYIDLTVENRIYLKQR